MVQYMNLTLRDYNFLDCLCMEVNGANETLENVQTIAIMKYYTFTV